MEDRKASRLRAEFKTIQKASKGLLRAGDALRWAREHPKSELHSHIEWDASKAAQEYQLWQVRQLISVYVVTPEQKRDVISLSIDRTKPGGGYRDVESVMSSKQLRAVALNDAINVLDSVRHRFEDFPELAPVWAALDAVKRKVAPKLKTAA